MPAVLPYHEPTLIHLLVFSSFLYLLNIIRVAADFLIHGGIVAEITLGIIFGSPLAGLLHVNWEATFTVLGYIGLVLVVFEGGLSSNLRMLLSNLPLSLVCAATGIIFPIALSFASLYAGFGYRPLEAFAAGAALSSDSLGTTLAALNSAAKSSSASLTKGRTLTVDSERTTCALPLTRTLSPARRADTSATLSAGTPPNSLKQSRIGTVLISAAIIDDVIGLVVAAVMPALALVQHDTSAVGGSSIAWPVVRPLLASVLMAFIAPVVSRFVLRPVFWWSGCGERWCAPARPGKPWGFERLTESGWGTEMHADAAKLFLMVAMLSVMATISHYTGTSVLFGSYLSGLMLTYISQPPAPAGSPDADEPYPTPAPDTTLGSEHRANSLSFEETFTRLLGPVQEYVLLPLFFASIGFAIPFLDLWRPAMIWRGIVYSVLMCVAKLAVGVPILLYGPYLHYSPAVYASVRRRGASLLSPYRQGRRAEQTSPHDEEGLPRSSTLTSRHPALHEKTEAQADIRTAPNLPANPQDVAEKTHIPSEYRASTSVPAAAFMGAAMVARGEIGLLIAQLARGGSEHAPGGGVPGVLSEEPFLLCIWAILLCTLVGPVALGYFVRRWGPRLNSGIWA
ncbi:uncharacterized protein TRAVEDRAFT_45135 [Trametes versicolor FP-101664 SS1]|uniref:uncharacterized protein n=1 Tax=Trametes versicolor (strain FP-101664) TaxID=717944 RepID=UPI0004624716|nr:uncharacterized protein TRAVEDRAFT_45135 [Trametes versicolor FP-101664 SS1]EIW62308.1 hypothetical protein TRAVEDRAFT_45135 [Trametes versicolor FP-101664 SS1]